MQGVGCVCGTISGFSSREGVEIHAWHMVITTWVCIINKSEHRKNILGSTWVLYHSGSITYMIVNYSSYI